MTEHLPSRWGYHLKRSNHFSKGLFLKFLDLAEKPTPWKINMEHNHGGLEDHVPF